MRSLVVISTTEYPYLRQVARELSRAEEIANRVIYRHMGHNMVVPKPLDCRGGAAQIGGFILSVRWSELVSEGRGGGGGGGGQRQGGGEIATRALAGEAAEGNTRAVRV